MPTILRIKGYRFFFYINDHSPPHIHEKDNSTAKFGLDPIEIIRSKRFNVKEINEIRKLVMQHNELLKTKWHEFFNNK